MKHEIKYGIILVLLLICSCFQPILIDVIKYNGCGSPSTFIFLIPHYFSMILVGLLPKEQKLAECNWLKMFMLSVIDIINQILKKVGLVYAGCAIYVIIDSFTLISTAMWRRIILKKKLTELQLMGILSITFGIGIRSNHLKFELEKEEVIGVILILLSNILMGLTLVLNEKYISEMDGQNIVCLMGLFCSLFLIVWTTFWTFPNFDKLIITNIQRSNGSIQTILLSFLLLFILNFISSSTLWCFIKKSGALFIGILKGMKVAIIFLFSHIFFCKYDEKQCLNVWSSLSVTFCILGVLLYSLSGNTHKILKRKQITDNKVDKVATV